MEVWFERRSSGDEAVVAPRGVFNAPLLEPYALAALGFARKTRVVTAGLAVKHEHCCMAADARHAPGFGGGRVGLRLIWHHRRCAFVQEYRQQTAVVVLVDTNEKQMVLSVLSI